MLENIIYLFVGAILAILPNYVTDAIKHRRQKILKKENEKILLKAFCAEIEVAISSFKKLKEEALKKPQRYTFAMHFGLWEMTKLRLLEQIEDFEILRLLIRIYDNLNNINSIIADIAQETPTDLSYVSKIDISVAEKDYSSLIQKIESTYKIKINMIKNAKKTHTKL